MHSSKNGEKPSDSWVRRDTRTTRATKCELFSKRVCSVYDVSIHFPLTRVYLQTNREKVIALRLIGNTCPTAILFGGCPDQWAPLSHMKKIEELKSKAVISNVECVYMEELTHDFIVHPHMIEPVIQFCLDQIKHPKLLRSKL